MMSATNIVHTRKRAYSLREVSELTGLSLPYLRNLDEKVFKTVRFGRAIRVLDEDLEAFLKNGVEGRASKATA